MPATPEQANASARAKGNHRQVSAAKNGAAFHHKLHSRPTSKAPDSQRDVLYHIDSCTSRWADVKEVRTGNPGGGNAHKNPLIIQGVQRELQRPQLMYAPLSINQFAPKTIEEGPLVATQKRKSSLKDRSARPSQIL